MINLNADNQTDDRITLCDALRCWWICNELNTRSEIKRTIMIVSSIVGLSQHEFLVPFLQGLFVKP